MPTLDLTYATLEREIGRYLGDGRANTSFSANDTLDVADIIASGLRRFYWPPPSDEAKGQHVWSFLSPNADLVTVSGTHEYLLPVDFSGMFARGFTHAEGVEERPLSRTSEQAIEALYAKSNRSGVPKYFATRVRNVDGKSRYFVSLYPEPDAAYTLTYAYAVEPKTLDTDNTTPLGGAVHAETIIEACLAAAEERIEDGGSGLHAKRFMELLVTSIRIDRTANGGMGDVWPEEIPAANLGVNLAYLRRVLGRHIGLGPHPATWTHREFNEVELIIQTGLRKFYNPPCLDRSYPHEWSFLKPIRPINTQADASTYELPEEFEMMDGPLTYAPGSNSYLATVNEVGEHQLRKRLEYATAAGRPRLYAIRPKQTNGAVGTRFEIMLWPIPDGAYTLHGRMRITPPLLAADRDQPYGGKRHAQTVIEACLCAADELRGTQGIHGKQFIECLRASIGHDQRADSPESFGQNLDPDNSDEYGGRFSCNSQIVTYNGVTPS